MSLTNAQYNKIMRVYDDRRMENNRKLEYRRKTAYEKLPELKTLEDFVRSESIKTFHLMRDGQ